MNEFFLNNLRKPEEIKKKRNISKVKSFSVNPVTLPLHINKMQAKNELERNNSNFNSQRGNSQFSKRFHTAYRKPTQSKAKLFRSNEMFVIDNKNFLYQDQKVWPNNFIKFKCDENFKENRNEIKKPSTANYISRPQEGLKKGQNQLILERLQEKYNFLCKETKNKMYSTSSNFFNRTQTKSTNNIVLDTDNQRKDKILGIKMKEEIEIKELKKEKDKLYEDKFDVKNEKKETSEITKWDDAKFFKTMRSSFKNSSNMINSNYDTLTIIPNELKSINVENECNIDSTNNHEDRKSIQVEIEFNNFSKYKNEELNSIKIQSESNFESIDKYEELHSMNIENQIKLDTKYKNEELISIKVESQSKIDSKDKYEELHSMKIENESKIDNSSKIKIKKIQHSSPNKIETNNTMNFNTEKIYPTLENSLIANEGSNDNIQNGKAENKDSAFTNFKNNINNIKENDRAEKNNESKFKMEDINVADIIKRFMEKNKKEAAVRQREFFSNFPQSYMNLNLNMNKSQGRFFIGTPGSSQNRSESYNRPFTERKDGKDQMNYLEIINKDTILWKKHEEIWNNLHTNPIDLEKYLIPPNDLDVLISSYNKLNNTYPDKIIIDDNIPNAKEEIQKWKKAYKCAVLRWHPDKLFHFLETIKLRDENIKITLKKKAGIIMNNINKFLQNILEILRKIDLFKERGKEKFFKF